MTTRQELLRLVKQLPDGELEAARRYLQYLRDLQDPLLRKLMTAPLDDEPETEEERRAVAESKADYRAGRYVTLQEAKRQLLRRK